MKKYLEDKYLYLPILILGIYLVIRLIDQSKIIWIFPLDKFNDWASYMAQLHFLKVCGFHNFCPYWYNGFISFQITQPGWYFFIYPLYLLLNNVQLITYLSLIISFILSLIALYIGGKKLNLSKVRILAFFLFFFGNAVSIGNFIKLGKIHQLFGWFNLIVIFLFLLIYKDKKLDKNFFLIIPFYFFAILSHQNTAAIGFLAILGLFLIKKFKEKILIIITVLISLLLTSFWWLGYVKNFSNTASKTIIVGETLRVINKTTLNDNIASFVIPILFLVILYIYLKSGINRKKELIFLLPQIIIALLLLTRLILFIPLLKYVFPDSYNLFLLFFAIFMFFKIDFNLIKYESLVIYSLVLISILSILLSILFISKFIEHTELEKETLGIFPYSEKRFVLLATPLRKTSYPNAYYSYAAIYHNLSTAGGWYPSMVNNNYINKLESLDNLIKNKNCEILKKELNELNTSEVITYDENCEFLDRCGFNKKINKSRVCLYSL